MEESKITAKKYLEESKITAKEYLDQKGVLQSREYWRATMFSYPAALMNIDVLIGRTGASSTEIHIGDLVELTEQGNLRAVQR